MNLTILGSTGSIGTQSLDVAQQRGICVRALAAKSNISLLEQQAREFRPALVAVEDESCASALKAALKDTDCRVVSGRAGVLEAAAEERSDTVLNALVGIAGLEPTIAALQAGKRLALANKETLVAGGDLVMKLAEQRGLAILPVDSEHSAIFQCLQGAAPNQALSRIILTASGGPFFGRSAAELRDVRPQDALRHPNWDMGAKITIDSATMMNKGLEVIEAVHLFRLPQEKIDVVVHRESIIHSMVEYNDNSVIAQMGLPDMRIPIQYALTYPERYPSPVGRLDLIKARALTFYEPDTDAFPCLAICRAAVAKGGLAPAAVNGANEVAVARFLKGEIGFCDIAEIASTALEMQNGTCYKELNEILEADRAARAMAMQYHR